MATPLMRVIVAVATMAAAVVVATAVQAPANPPITSAEIMGHGFNAKMGRPGLFPVMDWTYQFGNSWTSPVTGTTYMVPDQLDVAVLPESATKIVQTMSASYDVAFSEYQSWFSFSVGIDDPGVFGLAFQYNHELDRIKLEVSENLKMYGFSQYWCTYYTLDMAPAYMLNPSGFFKLAISKLPPNATSAENALMYNEFVTSYGTHYVCYGAFGGSAHLDTFVDQSLTKSYSRQQVAQQMGFTFNFYFFNISAGGFHNKTDIHFAQWFAANAHSFSYFNGGTPAYQTNGTIPQWLESIPDNAGLLNTTLCPLTELITWDPVRQASLKQYIHEYLQ